MKTLKMFLFLTMAITFSTQVYSQKDKCKFDVEKKDAFSGVEYKSVKIEVMATHEKANNRYTWEFVKNDSVFTLTISRNFPSRLTDKLPQGEEILFKLAGGSIIHLLIAEETTPGLNSTGTGVSTSYKIPIKISKDDLKKLSEKAITNLKFAVGKLDVQGELAKEEAEKIMQVCKCLLK